MRTCPRNKPATLWILAGPVISEVQAVNNPRESPQVFPSSCGSKPLAEGTDDRAGIVVHHEAESLDVGKSPEDRTRLVTRGSQATAKS